ncbi:MAG: 50S ribosomal protein L24 [Planctomycetota bacterium]|nr:50S ribosomal protein L24 [Planctomycetota bacterium]
MKKKSRTKIKTYLRRGDNVQVICGTESGPRDPKLSEGGATGKRGSIKDIDYYSGRAIVEGVNMRKKAVRPDPNRNRPGGIIETEGSIHISNLMLVCPKDDRPVRIGVRKLDTGKKVRYCRECDTNIGEEY